MKLRLLVFGLGILVLAPVLESCGRSCTVVGTFEGMVLDLDSPVSGDVARTCTVTVCRNEQCVTGSLSAGLRDQWSFVDSFFDPTPPTRDDVLLQLRPTSDAPSGWSPTVTVALRATDSAAPQIRVAWQDSSVRLANGDRYRFTMTTADGRAVASFSEAVTYNESYPNGPGCDPDPARQAHLDRRAGGAF
jgi:hypothetical protein